MYMITFSCKSTRFLAGEIKGCGYDEKIYDEMDGKRYSVAKKILFRTTIFESHVAFTRTNTDSDQQMSDAF